MNYYRWVCNIQMCSTIAAVIDGGSSEEALEK
jgi:hypothetical protein